MENNLERNSRNSIQSKQKEVVKGKKLVIITVVIVIIIFLSAQILYYYAIPRVTLDLKNVYHEATGGGGNGGKFPQAATSGTAIATKVP